MKPRIFIGSSSENKEIAEAISFNLYDISHPVVWDQSFTSLSQSTLTNLVKALETFDFAIFVFGGEDKATIRRDNLSIVRDNVIFETGLFMGKLGVDHVFFVKPQSKEIHMPSDLLGITYGEFDEEHPNREAALRLFCKQVKDQIKRTYSPEFPNNGIYGPNILYSESINLIGNVDIGGERITYGLYAHTSSTQHIVVKIVNNSKNPDVNLWYFAPLQVQGWLPSTYNGTQEFTLYPNTRGILNIFFVGNGSATITVIVNDEEMPLLEKDIFWKIS